jgi:hypothetical protein
MTRRFKDNADEDQNSTNRRKSRDPEYISTALLILAKIKVSYLWENADSDRRSPGKSVISREKKSPQR